LRTRTLFLPALALVVVALAAPGVALAEDPPASQQLDPGDVKVIKGPHGPKIIFKKPGIIYGRVHRPRAFYVLERSRLTFTSERLTRRLTPRILESVRRKPF
jgi:hypothetical protein